MRAVYHSFQHSMSMLVCPALHTSHYTNFPALTLHFSHRAFLYMYRWKVGALRYCAHSPLEKITDRKTLGTSRNGELLSVQNRWHIFHFMTRLLSLRKRKFVKRNIHRYKYVSRLHWYIACSHRHFECHKIQPERAPYYSHFETHCVDCWHNTGFEWICLKAADCPAAYFAGTNYLLCRHRLYSVTKKMLKKNGYQTALAIGCP